MDSLYYGWFHSEWHECTVHILAISSLAALLPWLCVGITTQECDSYQLSSSFIAGESCKEIYEWNPETYIRSAYYWLVNPPRHVYCDMEQRVECGSIGGWTRIASVDIAEGDDCPTGWNKATRGRVSFCRSSSDKRGCYPTLFSTKQITYQKVCGMARGYQKGTPDAFLKIFNITDGLIITHGDPRQHIWSYIAAFTEQVQSSYPDSNCPCGGNRGRGPDSFVGSDYYCEAGNSGEVAALESYYLSDPLWDGAGCPTGNTCCDAPNLPWFYRELDTATMDDIEVMICTDQEFGDEAVLVDKLELYVQ